MSDNQNFSLDFRQCIFWPDYCTFIHIKVNCFAGGHICWNYHQAARDFNGLMLKLCTDFADAKDESKFTLCETIRTVLRSFPKSSYGGDDLDAQAW